LLRVARQRGDRQFCALADVGSAKASAATPAPATTRRRPAEQRARTITSVATIHTEGLATLEGWMSGLDYADLADAIWSATCRN
jgi:hypothetical protein